MQHRSWLDRVVGGCLGLLVGAVAVFVAVKLIVAVWPVLVAIVGGLLLIVVIIAVVRARTRGW